MSSTIPRQLVALIRRYLVHIYRRPISNAIRGLLLPGLLIGFVAYMLPRAVDYTTDVNREADLVNFIPWFIFMAVFFQFYHFSQWLVNDRATGFKSLMLSMGLKRTSYYLANSICFLAYSLPVVITLSGLSVAYLMTKSQVSTIAIMMVFFLFNIHLTALLFVFASIITSNSYLALVPFILILETQCHSLIVWIMGRSSAATQPMVLFLGSMSPLESIRILCNSYSLCKNCDITQLSNGMVSQPTYLILIAMSVWTMVAFAFARWFEEVCPWQNDSAVKSPLFCFLGSKRKSSSKIEENTIMNSNYFEQAANNRGAGIYIKNLTKIFKKVPVVNNINFNVYKGETTLLLGHNGAGKTTLMDMILGKLEPSSGQVTLADSNGRLSFGKEDVGVCPQASILDDNLSVKQHLELFAGIKTSQMSSSELDEHIKTTIADVSLTSHMYKLPTELSGGMKRKLSLAMAFVGNSGILILDEPSSGLDPDSRVFIWNAIRRYRGNRTVLLSTQHMEEADYLGDRIAIMSEGRIICCGSSTFLNRIFGSGYRLRVECHTSKKDLVMDFVRKYFKTAKPSENIQTLTPPSSDSISDPIQDIVIELTDDKSKNLEMNLIKMLEEIEHNPNELHIKSHGLRSSSIEDVLLNTSRLSHKSNGSKTKVQMSSTSGLIATVAESNRTSNSGTVASQWTFLCALLSKHIYTYRRDWPSILVYRVLMPAAFIRFMVYMLDQKPTSETYNPGFGMVVLVFHYVYNPVMERASKFKTMQLTSRANFVVYWLAHILIESLSIILLVIYINLFFALSYNGEFLESNITAHTVLTIATFMMGLSAALAAYILSFVFSDSNTCMGYYLLLGLISVLAYVAIMMIGFASSKNLNWLQDISNAIFNAISPVDSFQYILYGLRVETSHFSPITYGFIALSAQILVYGTLLYLIEEFNPDLTWYLRWRNIFCCKKKSSTGMMRQIDDDVLRESSKATGLITSGIPRERYCMVASNLSKSYVAGQKVVDQLSFTVRRGECFGLLGVNGAGKTTTFSMLVDEMRPDSGKIWVDGHFNNNDATLYRQSFGYDPQSNPEMSLSPVNALYLMARLRCVHENIIPKLVDSILELLEMTEHAKKPARDLSGGTKRKLALGMCLIGNPALLALDEPTAGVDPMARRGIWQLLRSLRARNGSSIVISSHAMEECEAICDRISIMACGRLRCIGTFLSLRSKFSQGCSIRVHFSGSAIEQNMEETTNLISIINDRLIKELGGSVKLSDTNANSATFNVTDDRVKRSRIFIVLRDLRQNYPQISYMLNDSSLEDIFITLAREQQELEQSNSMAVV